MLPKAGAFAERPGSSQRVVKHARVGEVDQASHPVSGLGGDSSRPPPRGSGMLPAWAAWMV